MIAAKFEIAEFPPPRPETFSKGDAENSYPGFRVRPYLTLTKIRDIIRIYSLLIIMVIRKYKRESHDFQVFPIAGGKRLVEMPK